MTLKLDWHGDEVGKDVLKNVGAAMTEFGLRCETAAKNRLQPLGRGVRTGTLRRSIHLAEPGYSWRGDNVKPSPNTPERGGQDAKPVERQGKLTLELGSGMEYALVVHQDHPNAHHYITYAVDEMKPKLPSILERHKLK